MTEGEAVSLTITAVLFGSTYPATVMMIIRSRSVAVRAVMFRCGRPSRRQWGTGRKRFRTQKVLQLVVGFFTSYYGYLLEEHENI